LSFNVIVLLFTAKKEKKIIEIIGIFSITLLTATLILQLLIVRILTACFFMYVVKTLHVPQKNPRTFERTGCKNECKNRILNITLAGKKP